MSPDRFAEGVGTPEHSHLHEQAGIVLEGEIEIVISTESRRLDKAKETSSHQIHHRLKTWKDVRALDVSSPPREDYWWQVCRKTPVERQEVWQGPHPYCASGTQ